jgi:hypothetical protein
MNRETARRLAEAYLKGDVGAWKPFIDAMIELGYENIALSHYRTCVGGMIRGSSDDDNKCGLLYDVSQGNWKLLEIQENYYKYRGQ